MLVGKRKIKNPLGRRRSILEDNIKIESKGTRQERIKQINFAQKRKKVARSCEDGHKWPGFKNAQSLLNG